MKILKHFTIGVLLLWAQILCLSAIAQDNIEKRSSTEIKDVTVYFNQAQISRSGKVALTKGNYTLIFEKLSPSLIENSVSLKATGPGIIMSVEPRSTQLRQLDVSQKLKKLRDSLEIYQARALEIKDEELVFKTEEELLKSNLQMGGKDKALSAEELKQMANFMRSRLAEIRELQRGVQVNLKKTQLQMERIRKEVITLSSKENVGSAEVYVDLVVHSNATFDFELSYMVENAGWTPSYRIEADGEGDKAELTLFADVYQRTSEDWKNINLTLSSGNPSGGAQKPELGTYRAYLMAKNAYKKSSASYGRERGAYSDYATAEEENYADEEDGGWGSAGSDDYAESPITSTAAAYVESSEVTLAEEYAIKLPFSISAEGGSRKIEVKRETMAIAYQRYAAPSLDPSVYLLGYLTDWDQYNVYDGEMDIYLSGAYIGKSNIYSANISDTLTLSLGKDPSLTIERKKLTNIKESKIIGIYRKDVSAYEISLRNGRSKEVEVLVEDNIPVIGDSKITLEVGTLSGAEYNKDTGKIAWRVKLGGNSSQKVKFDYSLKYPKALILQMKTE